MESSKGKMDRFCTFLTRHRLTVLLVILAITFVFFYGATKIRSDVILAELFPYDHPYLKLHAKFARIFGTGASSAVIAVKVKDGDIFNTETLTKISDMTREIELWDEIYRILTVSMASLSVKVAKLRPGGEISLETLMFPTVPEGKEEVEDLKLNVFGTPAFNGKIIAEDGTAALIKTEFRENISYEKAFEVLRDLQARYSDENTAVHIVGFPMMMGWIYSLKPQMRMVFGVTIALMILILFLIFRNLTGMVAPIVVGLISTGIGLGFVGFIGINFSPLLYVLAFLVGARKISHAVQITHRYLEELSASGNDKERACFETMRAMIMPNVAGVTTDAAGFLVLILAKILLMQQIAIIMSFWMLSIAFSAILTPIICTCVPLRAASEERAQKSAQLDVWERVNMAMARFSIGPGRYALITGIIGLLVFCGWQSTRLKIGDATPGSPLLWPDHPYNQDQYMFNKVFRASSDNLMLYYEGTPGSAYDAEVLVTFSKFDAYMAETLPDIYKSSSSIISLGKAINLMYHEGDQMMYKLPRDEGALLEILGAVDRAGINAARRYMDVPKPARRGQITIYFADHTSDNMLRVRKAAYDFFKDNPKKTKNGEFLLAGGRIGLEIALNEEMKRSHLLIDCMVLLTIFIMCTFCFRSFTAALMLSVPLIIANMGAFAYMCMMNIGLSVNTLPVGIGVDFAIYLYARCVEEFPHQKDWTETVMVSVRTCGKAIMYTGLTLILAIIPWYFLSELKFQAQMGFFLAMLLFINVILALTLHPLLILMIKPKFITRHAAAQETMEKGGAT